MMALEDIDHSLVWSFIIFRMKCRSKIRWEGLEEGVRMTVGGNNNGDIEVSLKLLVNDDG